MNFEVPNLQLEKKIRDNSFDSSKYGVHQFVSNIFSAGKISSSRLTRNESLFSKQVCLSDKSYVSYSRSLLPLWGARFLSEKYCSASRVLEIAIQPSRKYPDRTYFQVSFTK